MPELPEVQAHAERLTETFHGQLLERFTQLSFTALKTARPLPDDAYGLPLQAVGRRGKYLLVEFEPVTFAVHLMQGGRLLVDQKMSAKPRGGQARFTFAEGPALLLTEQGTERRAGVWALPAAEVLTMPPLNRLGPEALEVTPESLNGLFLEHPMRVHGFLRDQHMIAGIGRRLANEICWQAKISPFANAAKLGIEGATAVVQAIQSACAEGLAYERTRPDMSSSADRPGGVHKRSGEPCPIDGTPIRDVEYSSYTVYYCPTCQTKGKVLADNTTSKFLK